MITEILNDTDELNCDIRIIVRADTWGLNNEFWGVQIDNTITPLYCCNCRKQLKNFYKLDGGRYGQVGTIICICGAEIHCTDSDNRVDYLDTLTTVRQTPIGKYYIDYTQTYKLDNHSFISIKEKVGFDIFNKYTNQTIDLKEIIAELEVEYNLRSDNGRQFNYDKFDHLPKIINKWYSILEKVNN